jgi:hypothetical protein
MMGGSWTRIVRGRRREARGSSLAFKNAGHRGRRLATAPKRANPIRWQSQPIPAKDGPNLSVRADLDARMLSHARLQSIVLGAPNNDAGARSQSTTIGKHGQ